MEIVMIEWFLDRTLVVQEIMLGAMGSVLVLFALAVYAQQFRRGVRPTWPLPGGLVGATFLFAVGLLPIMMCLLRLGVLGWAATGWQQTVVYSLIAICSVSTLIRWWRFGLDDDAFPWDGQIERRNGPPDRRGRIE